MDIPTYAMRRRKASKENVVKSNDPGAMVMEEAEEQEDWAGE